MIGKVLGNRYEILEKVGSGGMANVYKARDRMLNRYVAVKVLHSEFKEDEEFIRRFNIESQAAASLSHQNIVQIYDVGEENGIQYIVMEYLSGQTLKEYIKSKDGGLYWKEAIDYSMQICRALEHAHQKHIIHRDIKPQNIMITTDGILKVMDFGIARAVNNNTTKVNSAAIGSAHYLSPEQARGGYTDQRSDIYSLGVVMYELFTGQLPFDADTPVAVAMKHIQEEPLPPSKLNPTITRGIEQVILKAMSKEIRLRYNSAGELLDDLKKLYVDPAVILYPEKNDDNKSTQTETRRRTADRVSHQDDETMKRRKKRRRDPAMAMIATALATAVCLAVGIAITVGYMMKREPVEYDVPDLKGLSVEDAEDKLARLGEDYEDFTVEVEFYENSNAEKNTIISQTPVAGEKVDAPQSIKVVVSSGTGMVILGDYRGESFNAIEADLTKKGLEVKREEQSSDNFPSGIIISQDPASGTSLIMGETVTLYVSKGSSNAVVPNVVGRREADARADIERAGLAVGEVVREENEDYVRGLVYDQGYAPYTKVPEGTKVDIFVSNGAKSHSGDTDDEDGDKDDNHDASSTPSTQQPSSAQQPTQQPEVVDDPSSIEEMKTKYLSLALPTDRPRVTVKLICDGEVIYEKVHNTDTGIADISLKSRGVKNVDIYYDGEYETTREVNFD